MENPILVDESLFDEAFIPERLVSREWQIREISRSLKSTKVGKSIKNLYVFGPPGVGKTIVTKWILKEHFPKDSVYVNCWSNRTPHKVMEDVLRQMGSNFIHGKESTNELVKKFEKSKKKIIVCLDEFDHLEDADILYDLARSSCGLVLISNQAYSVADIDSRIKSRLFLDEIEFKAYNREEILDILRDRVSCGFRPGSISDSLLAIVSGICNGDARIGLQTLRVAASEAHLKGRNIVTVEEIKTAARCARKYRLSYLLGKLNEHQRIIYEILKKNRVMNSGDLFEEYCKLSTDVNTDRSYRNYMQRMVELDLVREIGSGRWKKYEIA
ncbi:MAG: Cdc6/Cdc18 family protein [Nitrososphaera sp.]